MGRFARSNSGALSERTANQAKVAARPRFIKDSQSSARKPQIRPQSFNQPISFLKDDKSKSRIFTLNRRKRKGMRIIGLCMLLLAGLGIGWVLGKAVLGPSRTNKPQPAISTANVIEDKSDKNIAEAAAIPVLEAKADDVQGLSYNSQDQNAVDDRSGRARNSGNARRTLVSSKARTGPGIGVVARPIKAVFGPLKRVNPFRLRLW